VPPIFRLLQERGAVERDEMLRTFNMGVGLVAVCAADAVGRVMTMLADAGERQAWTLGLVVAGDRQVSYSA
jgi:phosphoribosylformylglycinamidine cyclo-ligase